MQMLKFSQYGDWARANVVLRGLANNMTDVFRATIDKDGEMIRQKLIGHINAQDLGWTPLSPKTVARKGHDTIYVETGSLKNGIKVRRISSPAKGYSISVGCNPWTKNSKGDKLSDILIYLEYGTSKIPARPLLRPTWDEVKSVVKEDMRKTLRGLITGEIGG